MKGRNRWNRSRNWPQPIVDNGNYLTHDSDQRVGAKQPAIVDNGNYLTGNNLLNFYTRSEM